jgi:hypothetical protein
MLRDIVWQEAGYFGFDEPDKLHHTATLVSQHVTVEHVRAGEVHKLVVNPGPAGRHLAVDRHSRGNSNHVLPHRIRGGPVDAVCAPPALSCEGVSAIQIRSSVCDHDLAEMAAAFEMAVGCVGLGERECPVDHRAQAVLHDGPVHCLEIGAASAIRPNPDR